MTAVPLDDPIVSQPCVLERHHDCPEPRRCECGCHLSQTAEGPLGLLGLLRRFGGAR